MPDLRIFTIAESSFRYAPRVRARYYRALPDYLDLPLVRYYLRFAQRFCRVPVVVFALPAGWTQLFLHRAFAFHTPPVSYPSLFSPTPPSPPTQPVTIPHAGLLLPSRFPAFLHLRGVFYFTARWLSSSAFAARTRVVRAFYAAYYPVAS